MESRPGSLTARCIPAESPLLGMQLPSHPQLPPAESLLLERQLPSHLQLPPAEIELLDSLDFTVGDNEDYLYGTGQVQVGALPAADEEDGKTAPEDAPGAATSLGGDPSHALCRVHVGFCWVGVAPVAVCI